MTQGTLVEQTQIGESFAGAQVMEDIVTHAGHQYAAFYNFARGVIVMHRTVSATGDGPWSAQKLLAESSYNPDKNNVDHSYKSSWDSHDWIRLGVDADGQLHVAADHHGTEMRYWRTTTPGDVSTLTRRKDLVFTGPAEDLVTYPEFINNPNGHMRWMMFRDGSSGNGRVRVYEWDNTSDTWSQASIAFAAESGDGLNYNAYTDVFFTPSDGWYNIVYCWRRTSADDDSSRLCYIRTKDFKTYYNDAGVVQSTAIQQSNAACIVDDVPTGTPGFVNGEWQFGQIGNQRFIAYIKNKDLYVVATPAAGGQFGAPVKLTSVGNVGGLGNGFIDNYITVVDGTHLAVDFSLNPQGQPQGRVTFPVGDSWSAGAPNLPVTMPPKYYPDAVYQSPTADNPPLTGTSVYFRTRADSRSEEQAGGGYTRQYIGSRPLTGFCYVMGHLVGTERRSDPGLDPTLVANWPHRPVIVSKIAY